MTSTYQKKLYGVLFFAQKVWFGYATGHFVQERFFKGKIWLQIEIFIHWGHEITLNYVFPCQYQRKDIGVKVCAI